MIKILSRAFRATLFNRDAFKEAYFDDDSPADGAILVSLVGGLIYMGQLFLPSSLSAFDFRALLSVVIGSVVSWLILAFATWGVSRWMFDSMSRPQVMVGVHGLTVLPLLLDLSGSRIVGAIGLLWYLALLVVATQEVTDLDLKKSAVSV
ncbi:MAG: YIP1 family protein, partial [Acidimicrobiia bacterium]